MLSVCMQLWRPDHLPGKKSMAVENETSDSLTDKPLLTFSCEGAGL